MLDRVEVRVVTAIEDTATSTESRTSTGTPGRHDVSRSGAWSGVAFAALFTTGGFLLGELLGSFGDPDATFVAYFDTSSNRTGALLGGISLALAGLAFFWFLSNVRLCIDGAGALPGVVTAAGITFVTLLMCGAAALVTVPYARIFGSAYGGESVLVTGEALLPQLGYVLVTVLAMWAAAALMLAVTLAARRNLAFPRWLVRLGYISSVFVFLLGPSVIGILGVPFWVLAVSVHWLRVGSTRGP